jgi:hypothetical protein
MPAKKSAMVSLANIIDAMFSYRSRSTSQNNTSIENDKLTNPAIVITNEKKMIPRKSFLVSIGFCFALTFVAVQKYDELLTTLGNSRNLAISPTPYLRDGIQKQHTIVPPVTVISQKGEEPSPKINPENVNLASGILGDLFYSQSTQSNTTASGVTVNKESENFSQEGGPSMRKALECLRHTKPELPDISYPEDAFQHFHHIHHRLGRWVQQVDHKPHRASGYDGPWIENHWNSYFQQELESKNYSLPDVFGPYIPIFIPWTDIWVKNKWKYPKDLVSAMEDLLREDVMYITVNQNADGFVGRCDEFLDLQSKFHITVLSAGGYGHVPIPLLKQPEMAREKIPLNERQHLISYVGSKNNAPEHMRIRMIAQENHYYYYGKEWRDVMAQSKFSLCPRGFGRTSYHVMEALQMGLIPIHVYQDQPWLPYGNLMKNISYSVTIEELPDLISELSKMPDSEIAIMEDKIEKLRDDYFSFEGVLKQISRFMLNSISSELVCQELPSDSGSGKKETKACS